MPTLANVSGVDAERADEATTATPASPPPDSAGLPFAAAAACGVEVPAAPTLANVSGVFGPAAPMRDGAATAAAGPAENADALLLDGILDRSAVAAATTGCLSVRDLLAMLAKVKGFVNLATFVLGAASAPSAPATTALLLALDFEC